MFLSKLLALAACVLQLRTIAAQVELGFEEDDYAVREGRTGQFFLRTYVGTPSNDIVLRLIPLTVSGFQNYRNNNPTRTFAQRTLDDIAAIANPAEYEEESGGRRDFNSTELVVTFPASASELEVPVTGSFIFDDDIHEVNEEGFVIVLEIESSDPPAMVELHGSRDVLVFYIFDNDEIQLGFVTTSFTFAESVGVLTDTFLIEKQNNPQSEINITVIVNIMQDSSNPANSATQDEDYRPVSGGQYSYEIQFTPDQQILPAAPIEIVDDMSTEGNETFVLSLSPGSEAAIFNYEIPSSGRIATVLITDNDREVYMYPGREVREREGCYPEDTAQAQYEITADVRTIIREIFGL